MNHRTTTLLLIALITVAIVSAEDKIILDIPPTYQEVVAGTELWFSTHIDAELLTNTPTIVTHSISCDGMDVTSMSEQILSTDDTELTTSIEIPQGLDNDCELKTMLWGVNNSEARAEFRVVSEQDNQVLESSLLELTVEIPKNYQSISTENQVLSSIKLLNRGSDGRIDVFLDLWVEDAQGNTIFSKKETVAVETQANFVRNLDLPTDLAPGSYTLYGRVTYADGKSIEAHSSFQKIAPSQEYAYYFIMLIGAVLICAIIIITYYLHKKGTFVRARVKSEVRNIIKHKQLEEHEATTPSQTEQR